MHGQGLKNSCKHSAKGLYPFSLGTTSYIIPSSIVPNVRILGPMIDDIELVLFESPDVSNILSENDIKELNDIADCHSLTYTVHLPTDKKAGSEKIQERHLFCNAAKKIIERCSALNPHSWILHLEGINADADVRDVNKWQERCCKVIESVCSFIDDPSTIALENLNYPYQWYQKFISDYDLSLCCDIGHIWLYSENQWVQNCENMLPKTRVIHLHGVNKNHDHLSLIEIDTTYVIKLLDILNKFNYTGIVTLEVFNESDLKESMEVVNKLWEQLHW